MSKSRPEARKRKGTGRCSSGHFAVFSIVSARERHWFWATRPSKTFLSALTADALTGTVLTFAGLPGLEPLPWWQTLAIFVSAVVACLGVNDAVKVAMIKRRSTTRPTARMAGCPHPVDEDPRHDEVPGNPDG